MKPKLFLTAMIPNLFWGFGFVATIWALQSFSTVQILFIRFLIVGLLGLGLSRFSKSVHLKNLLKISFVPALFLIMEIWFQVDGLNSTTASNAGFLTVTYVVMVPLLEKTVGKKSIPVSHWFWVGLALIGTALMVNLQSLSFHVGDLLMLLSALGASLHLIAVEKIVKKTSQLFLTNAIQSLWAAIIFLPIVVAKADPWPLEISFHAWLGLASIVFGSTLLAFYFQMKAQVELSPTTSSLLFLIESPLAAIFGFYFLKEKLLPLQLAGGVLILISAAGVVLQKTKQKAV